MPRAPESGMDKVTACRPGRPRRNEPLDQEQQGCSDQQPDLLPGQHEPHHTSFAWRRDSVRITPDSETHA